MSSIRPDSLLRPSVCENRSVRHKGSTGYSITSSIRSMPVRSSISDCEAVTSCSAGERNEERNPEKAVIIPTVQLPCMHRYTLPIKTSAFVKTEMTEGMIPIYASIRADLTSPALALA